MPTQDDYLTLASEIARRMNAFGFAFKTYNINQLDEMIASIAGTGARISGGGDTSEHFETALLHRGFVVFPQVKEALNGEGYIRIYRTNSIVGNLLAAFRFPGGNGDEQLANLLNQLKRHRNIDEAAPDS